MKTKKILMAGAALLAITMSMTACGQNTPAATTTAAQAETTTTTAAVTEKAETTAADIGSSETAYTIIVLDEAGNPVQGAAVQFCSDEQCLFQKTGADGIATFTEPEGKYTVHMLKVPEGYAEDKTEYDVPETYGTVTITLKADNGGAADTGAEESSSSDSQYGVIYTPGAEVEGLKGCYDAHGMFLNMDSNPRTAVFSVTYYGFEPEYLNEYFDYLHEYTTAMGSGSELPPAPHERWEYGMALQAPVLQIIIVDGDGEFDPTAVIPGVDLTQFTLLAEKGKTKFYLYPQEMAGAGMEDSYKEAMGDYYDEYVALKANYEAFLANCTFTEAERPKDEGMTALESLVFEGTDLDGNKVNTADLFAGHKVTMVNFWATWCNPCIGELPELERMSKEFEKKDCQIIGICIDAYEDSTIATAKDIIANSGVDYTNLRGWETLLDEIPTSGYPTTYYVDSEGKIIGNRLTGAAITKYESELDNALSLVG